MILFKTPFIDFNPYLKTNNHYRLENSLNTFADLHFKNLLNDKEVLVYANSKLSEELMWRLYLHDILFKTIIDKQVITNNDELIKHISMQILSVQSGYIETNNFYDFLQQQTEDITLFSISENDKLKIEIEELKFYKDIYLWNTETDELIIKELVNK